MQIWDIQVPFSGQSRGYRNFTIKAKSKEEALEKFNAGEGIEGEDYIVRDDREFDEDDAVVVG